MGTNITGYRLGQTQDMTQIIDVLPSTAAARGQDNSVSHVCTSYLIMIQYFK